MPLPGRRRCLRRSGGWRHRLISEHPSGMRQARRQLARASSNEGDVVLDPFCGWGTAVDAAQKLKAQMDRDRHHPSRGLVDREAGGGSLSASCKFKSTARRRTSMARAISPTTTWARFSLAGRTWLTHALVRLQPDCDLPRLSLASLRIVACRERCGRSVSSR